MGVNNEYDINPNLIMDKDTNFAHTEVIQKIIQYLQNLDTNNNHDNIPFTMHIDKINTKEGLAFSTGKNNNGQKNIDNILSFLIASLKGKKRQINLLAKPTKNIYSNYLKQKNIIALRKRKYFKANVKYIIFDSATKIIDVL